MKRPDSIGVRLSVFAKFLEPRVGVEPTTCRLRIDCSTTELPRPCFMTIASAENHCQFAPNRMCLEIFNERRGTSPSQCRRRPTKTEIATTGCIARGLSGDGGR